MSDLSRQGDSGNRVLKTLFTESLATATRNMPNMLMQRPVALAFLQRCTLFVNDETPVEMMTIT